MELTIRSFLVTGATKGIGGVAADRLAHRVIGFARSSVPDFPGILHAVDPADAASSRYADGPDWQAG